jgi:hypothetical protein
MPAPPEQHDDLAYHAARAPQHGMVLTQLDSAIAYLVRDFLPALRDGLRHNFPAASAALPPAQWQRLGLAAAALLGVNWLVTLGPETAGSLVSLGWIGLAGFAGWSVLQQARLTRVDATAQRFAQHTAELSAAAFETRIAGLAGLDQLAFDHPRYRRPLVHLLAAWLAGREQAGAGDGHDCAVARQMLAEFHQLLAQAPPVQRDRAAGQAFIADMFPATAAAVSSPAEAVPPPAAAPEAEPVAPPPELEVVPAAELPDAAAEARDAAVGSAESDSPRAVAQ